MTLEGKSTANSAASTTHAAPSEVTEQELQSKLFRLAILLATALSTIDEATPPATLPSGSKLPSSESFVKLSEQLHNDLVQLFNLAQKTATNLTLALKPSRNALAAASASSGSSVSPIGGLDAASLTAASAQLDAFSSEVLPKLAFLARKAAGEAQIFVRAAPRELSQAEKDERTRLEKEVTAIGGRIVDPSEATPPAKVPGLGLGLNLTKAIRHHVRDVMENVAGLCTSLMDANTLKVVHQAAAARARADGVRNGPIATQSLPLNAMEGRKKALEATAKVWAACDQATKELPTFNKEVVLKKWKEREEVMEDGWNELREGAGVDDAQPERDRESASIRQPGRGHTTSSSRTNAVDLELDESDPFAALQNMKLDDDEAAKAARFVPLIKLGRFLHGTLGRLLKSTFSRQQDQSVLDYDELHVLGERMLEAQDDLVAALLYGEQELGNGEDSDKEQATTLSGAVNIYVKIALQLVHESGVDALLEHAKSAALASKACPDSHQTAVKNVRICVEEMSKLGKSLAEQSDADG
ncbi:hypothetical protein CBOM_03778 [Ceraceosorus bombacis]|uniref:Cyclin-D1-binding protein 1-like N-terminal domain-containing protein n=1 Tax=Ceraceosorus bombacis TaxID=401625 RepID=A0A0P1BI20_9BASI|nr:hypothetical protein CBOM_03778 [Ceraceosorus bombacis]